ncbi:hypothetical protein CRI94_15585 [Longibacter salinarum]|uniref:histidine kinase n=1 Tax=Longibacter salinarum TaxID=1850348 RepID=A0A2A8CUD6_9BACT|nr:hybrid sensor histidine kinase/response regulator transcription factor [Longibacter salinarum]PEN11455.1 hypothetical protein CRI94_15585 [Longibacter salinarum]
MSISSFVSTGLRHDSGRASGVPVARLAISSVLALLAVTLLPACLHAQSGSGNGDVVPPRIRFERLTLEDGLSQGHIYDILQDRRGFMWFATESGLNRYDGHDFKVYEPRPFDSESLSDGTINDIHEAQDGSIWVATQFGGVNRLDPLTDTVTRFQHDPDDPRSLPPGPVNVVYEDRGGILWVGTDNGLARMAPGRPGRFTHFRHASDDPRSISSSTVRSIRDDAEGRLWITTANGLNRMDLDAPGHFTRFLDASTSPNSSGPTSEHSLHGQYASPQRPDVRWIGSDDGLIRFDATDGSSRRFYPHSERAPGENIVMNVSPDPVDSGALWVATMRRGLARFQTNTASFTRYDSNPTDRHGLLDLASTHVFTGRSGMIWVGTAGAGINLFNPHTMAIARYGVSMAGPGLLRNPNVWGVEVTGDSTLWVSTSESYLHRINLGTGVMRVWQADPANPLDPMRPAATAFDFAEHADGTLWVGTEKSLDRYDPTTERFRHYRHDPADSTSISNHNINVLEYDRSGALWVGTPGGLNRYDPETDAFVRYEHDEATPDGRDWIGYVFEDRAGRLWVAHDEGVCQLDRSTGAFVTHFHHDPGDPSSLTNGRFGWIHERPQEPGVLWVSSLDGGGLDRIDTRTGAITHYTTETANFPDDTMYAILEGSDGRLWLSTNHGLIRFDPDATPPHRPVRQFGLESGLQGLEFNQHAATERDGQLVFGGVNGLNVFRPAAMEGNEVAPKVTLTNLRVWNQPLTVGPDSPLQQPVAQTEALHLTHDQNQVTIEFLALHFKNPKSNRYRYRLEGYDDQWVDAGTRREATYTNLPPGTYTFRVRASNVDGVWSETGASLQLHISPPWWQTSFAYVLYILLLGGVIGGGVYVQRQRQQRLEDAVDARTRQVRDQNEQLARQAEELKELDAAKRRFFANISHEFRTPLTILLGPTRDALRSDAPMSNEDVERVHRNGLRLQALIDQLLDLSALDAGGMDHAPEWHDLGPIVQATASIFAPLAKRGEIEMDIDLPASPVYVYVDAEHLQTALKNLVSNAIKYTPSGGRVDIVLSWSERSDSGKGAIGEVEIRVSDSGPGIPETEKEHVFDRFHRGDSVAARTAGGSGIGLSLAHELVTLNDGRLEVESRSESGTTFVIGLSARTSVPGGAGAPALSSGLEDEMCPPAGMPVDLSHDAAAEEGESTTTEKRERKAKEEDERPVVLVVDDNQDVRRYIRSVLESDEETRVNSGHPDFAVIEAANGRLGLNIAKERLPDCIVADVMMPEMDGFEMGRALMDDPMTEGIPLLYLTARAAPEDEVDGLRLGADDYLVKPFDSQLLRVRVNGLIQKRMRLRELHQRSEMTPPGGDGQDIEPVPPSPFVASVRSAIADNLSDPDFGVGELAEAVALSRSQLYRRLKDELDQTPSALLRTERLQHARRLLKSQEGTVSEIAYAVGFNSLSYFSTAFRKHYDESPSDVPVEPAS